MRESFTSQNTVQFVRASPQVLNYGSEVFLTCGDNFSEVVSLSEFDKNPVSLVNFADEGQLSKISAFQVCHPPQKSRKVLKKKQYKKYVECSGKNVSPIFQETVEFLDSEISSHSRKFGEQVIFGDQVAFFNIEKSTFLARTIDLSHNSIGLEFKEPDSVRFKLKKIVENNSNSVFFNQYLQITTQSGKLQKRDQFVTLGTDAFEWKMTQVPEKASLSFFSKFMIKVSDQEFLSVQKIAPFEQNKPFRKYEFKNDQLIQRTFQVSASFDELDFSPIAKKISETNTTSPFFVWIPVAVRGTQNHVIDLETSFYLKNLACDQFLVWNQADLRFYMMKSNSEREPTAFRFSIKNGKEVSSVPFEAEFILSFEDHHKQMFASFGDTSSTNHLTAVVEDESVSHSVLKAAPLKVLQTAIFLDLFSKELTQIYISLFNLAGLLSTSDDENNKNLADFSSIFEYVGSSHREDNFQEKIEDEITKNLETFTEIESKVKIMGLRLVKLILRKHPIEGINEEILDNLLEISSANIVGWLDESGIISDLWNIIIFLWKVFLSEPTYPEKDPKKNSEENYQKFTFSLKERQQAAKLREVIVKIVQELLCMLASIRDFRVIEAAPERVRAEMFELFPDEMISLHKPFAKNAFSSSNSMLLALKHCAFNFEIPLFEESSSQVHSFMCQIIPLLEETQFHELFILIERKIFELVSLRNGNFTIQTSSILKKKIGALSLRPIKGAKGSYFEASRVDIPLAEANEDEEILISRTLQYLSALYSNPTAMNITRRGQQYSQSEKTEDSIFKLIEDMASFPQTMSSLLDSKNLRVKTVVMKFIEARFGMTCRGKGKGFESTAFLESWEFEEHIPAVTTGNEYKSILEISLKVKEELAFCIFNKFKLEPKACGIFINKALKFLKKVIDFGLFTFSDVETVLDCAIKTILMVIAPEHEVKINAYITNKIIFSALSTVKASFEYRTFVRTSMFRRSVEDPEIFRFLTKKRKLNLPGENLIWCSFFDSFQMIHKYLVECSLIYFFANSSRVFQNIVYLMIRDCKQIETNLNLFMSVSAYCFASSQISFKELQQMVDAPKERVHGEKRELGRLTIEVKKICREMISKKQEGSDDLVDHVWKIQQLFKERKLFKNFQSFFNDSESLELLLETLYSTIDDISTFSDTINLIKLIIYRNSVAYPFISLKLIHYLNYFDDDQLKSLFGNIPNDLDSAPIQELIIVLIKLLKKSPIDLQSKAFVCLESIVNSIQSDKYSKLVFSMLMTSDISESFLVIEKVSKFYLIEKNQQENQMKLISLIASCVQFSLDVAQKFAKMVSFEKLVYIISHSLPVDFKMNVLRIISCILQSKFKISYIPSYIYILQRFQSEELADIKTAQSSEAIKPIGFDFLHFLRRSVDSLKKQQSEEFKDSLKGLYSQLDKLVGLLTRLSEGLEGSSSDDEIRISLNLNLTSKKIKKFLKLEKDDELQRPLTKEDVNCKISEFLLDNGLTFDDFINKVYFNDEENQIFKLQYLCNLLNIDINEVLRLFDINMSNRRGDSEFLGFLAKIQSQIEKRDLKPQNSVEALEIVTDCKQESEQTIIPMFNKHIVELEQLSKSYSLRNKEPFLLSTQIHNIINSSSSLSSKLFIENIFSLRFGVSWARILLNSIVLISSKENEKMFQIRWPKEQMNFMIEFLLLNSVSEDKELSLYALTLLNKMIVSASNLNPSILNFAQRKIFSQIVRIKHSIKKSLVFSLKKAPTIPSNSKPGESLISNKEAFGLFCTIHIYIGRILNNDLLKNATFKKIISVYQLLLPQVDDSSKEDNESSYHLMKTLESIIIQEISLSRMKNLSIDLVLEKIMDFVQSSCKQPLPQNFKAIGSALLIIQSLAEIGKKICPNSLMLEIKEFAFSSRHDPGNAGLVAIRNLLSRMLNASNLVRVELDLLSERIEYTFPQLEITAKLSRSVTNQFNSYVMSYMKSKDRQDLNDKLFLLAQNFLANHKQKGRVARFILRKKFLLVRFIFLVILNIIQIIFSSDESNTIYFALFFTFGGFHLICAVVNVFKYFQTKSITLGVQSSNIRNFVVSNFDKIYSILYAVCSVLIFFSVTVLIIMLLDIIYVFKSIRRLLMFESSQITVARTILIGLAVVVFFSTLAVSIFERDQIDCNSLYECIGDYMKKGILAYGLKWGAPIGERVNKTYVMIFDLVFYLCFLTCFLNFLSSLIIEYFLFLKTSKKARSKINSFCVVCGTVEEPIKARCKELHGISNIFRMYVYLLRLGVEECSGIERSLKSGIEKKDVRFAKSQLEK